MSRLCRDGRVVRKKESFTVCFSLPPSFCLTAKIHLPRQREAWFYKTPSRDGDFGVAVFKPPLVRGDSPHRGEMSRSDKGDGRR